MLAATSFSLLDCQCLLIQNWLKLRSSGTTEVIVVMRNVRLSILNMQSLYF